MLFFEAENDIECGHVHSSSCSSRGTRHMLEEELLVEINVCYHLQVVWSLDLKTVSELKKKLFISADVTVLGFSRETEPIRRIICRKRFIMKNWLIRLVK